MHWPAWPYLAAAVLLIPLVGVAATLAQSFPRLLELLHQRQLLVEAAFAGNEGAWWPVLVLALALVTAAGQEIAFRGFIFAGLLMRMRPWPAILVSSFMFAAFPMNVFLLPPLFVLGVALGTLALRSGSLLPGIILHASCYAMLYGSTRLIKLETDETEVLGGTLHYAMAAATTLAAAGLFVVAKSTQRFGAAGGLAGGASARDSRV